MTTLDHYVYSFFKWLDMLNTLIVTRQSFLKPVIKKLFKKYNKIWKKINALIGKESDSEPIYGDNDKYKTKIIWG